ncbi:hypothetical protein FEF22_001935 [Texas Phoenix palm phytoplasma]|uniref:Uncharacterized protein n=1 Tax=Texas Phoenix palm phytoplasma TaxID=176709 RepID=A0ABS5BIY2_9MOLU|nr:hypothetical protein [Texas Phoenix palm phytoplasma]MBP3059533.1 hypothetical protein [Texas Phoenix palm phytoplasma]
MNETIKLKCNFLQEKIKKIKEEIQKTFSKEKEKQITLSFKNQIFDTISTEIDNKFSKVIVAEQHEYLENLKSIISSINEEKFQIINHISNLTKESNLKFEEIKENFLNISEKLDFFLYNLKTFEEINNNKLTADLKINNNNFLKLREKVDNVVALSGGINNIHETYNSLKKINIQYNDIYEKINQNKKNNSDTKNIIIDKLYILELFWIMFSFLLLILLIIIIIIILKRRKNKKNNFFQDKIDHHKNR